MSLDVTARILDLGEGVHSGIFYPDSMVEENGRLRADEEGLAADVQALTWLQEVGNYCMRAGDNFEECLDRILSAGIGMAEGDKGCIQLLDAESGAIVIAAHRGFESPFLEYFKEVREEHATVCGEAKRTGKRVVAEDVTRSALFAGTPALDVLLAAGVRAVHSTPLLSSGGNLLGVISTHYGRARRPAERSLRWMDSLARLAADYVERKQSEQAVARLAAIVNQSDDAIVSKDLNGIIRSWNHGAEQLFGYRAEEVIGKPVTVLMPPELANEEPAILERIRKGERVEHYETVRRRKDGTLLDVSLAVSPIKDARGRVVGASKIARDITEKKRANEKLEQVVAERTASLREAIAQMEEFSYTVSHDLRAPLRGMQVYSEALLQDFGESLPREAVHYLNRIAANARQLDKMVLDVLTFSRVARSDFRLERVELEPLTYHILEQYPGLQEPHAEVTVGPLPEVLGHEPSLTQALSNLLNNAVKFALPGVKPTVRVWGERTGRDGMVRVNVRDNGIGIEPEFQHRLFRMFERIHPHLKQEGTGVGLAIVRKAVERMGGRVGVESDGRCGSTFWFEVRAAEGNMVKP